MSAAAAKKIFREARYEGRGFLFEHEAKRLLSLYGLPVTRFSVSKTEEEAVAAAREIGFPVVLKVVSPQVVHKSDVGGVLVGVEGEEGVRAGFKQIIENVRARAPEAEVVGILVQEMAPASTEVIVGSIKDPTFGPTVMFGLGGIFTEVLEDVSFRLAPITRADAEEMIREIRSHRILEGARGMPRADREAIVEILLRTSRMLMECPEIRELDMNPVLVYERGAKVVDARVILEPVTPRPATS